MQKKSPKQSLLIVSALAAVLIIGACKGKGGPPVDELFGDWNLILSDGSTSGNCPEPAALVASLNQHGSQGYSFAQSDQEAEGASVNDCTVAIKALEGLGGFEPTQMQLSRADSQFFVLASWDELTCTAVDNQLHISGRTTDSLADLQGLDLDEIGLEGVNPAELVDCEGLTTFSASLVLSEDKESLEGTFTQRGESVSNCPQQVSQYVGCTLSGTLTGSKAAVGGAGGNPTPPPADEPDPDGSPPPVAEICFDGVDNDRDGSVDCADPDCEDNAVCIVQPPPGAVDDPDGPPPPVTEICDDDVDNDGDESIDCDDSDCAGDAFCPEAEPLAVNCENYCDLMMETCTDKNKQYGSHDLCVEYCRLFPTGSKINVNENSLHCRFYWLDIADRPGQTAGGRRTSCRNAGLASNGECGSPGVFYCDLMLEYCPGSFADRAKCFQVINALEDGISFVVGNTMQCYAQAAAFVTTTTAGTDLRAKGCRLADPRLDNQCSRADNN
jgi:hypothetical protein